ncbi:hypothetical protein BCAR13_110036 [Paraburkholderia caribensis]|nr:hypothetical protein BCAR13_110036 [Paraburkholderia caribensis]
MAQSSLDGGRSEFANVDADIHNNGIDGWLTGLVCTYLAASQAARHREACSAGLKNKGSCRARLHARTDHVDASIRSARQSFARRIAVP